MNRRRFLGTLGVVGAMGTSGCSSLLGSSGDANGSNASPTATRTAEPTQTPAAPETRSGSALTGVYPGGNDIVGQLSTYSDWLAHTPAVAVLFVDGLAPLGAAKNFVEGPLTNVWEAGYVPMVTWQPFLGNAGNTPENVETRLANGDYDDRLDEWATQFEQWTRPRGDATRGRRFYFRPAHEMNGNWFPWSAVDSSRITATVTSGPNSSGTGTTQDYVDMWTHLHELFSKTGMDSTDIQWVWSPNADEPSGSIRAEEYYPGDEYVDWVGLDGFNFGDNENRSTWRTPSQVFNGMIQRMDDLTDKPKALTEFASSSVVESNGNRQHQPQRKAEWIEQAFSYVDDNDIKLTCWFNEDKPGTYEGDWAVFGGDEGTSTVTVDGNQYQAYDTYKQTVGNSKYLGALPDYPPLLTDDEFAGNF